MQVDEEKAEEIEPPSLDPPSNEDEKAKAVAIAVAHAMSNEEESDETEDDSEKHPFNKIDKASLAVFDFTDINKDDLMDILRGFTTEVSCVAFFPPKDSETLEELKGLVDNKKAKHILPKSKNKFIVDKNMIVNGYKQRHVYDKTFWNNSKNQFLTLLAPEGIFDVEEGYYDDSFPENYDSKNFEKDIFKGICQHYREKYDVPKAIFIGGKTTSDHMSGAFAKPSKVFISAVEDGTNKFMFFDKNGKQQSSLYFNTNSLESIIEQTMIEQVNKSLYDDDVSQNYTIQKHLFFKLYIFTAKNLYKMLNDTVKQDTIIPREIIKKLYEFIKIACEQVWKNYNTDKSKIFPPHWHIMTEQEKSLAEKWWGSRGFGDLKTTDVIWRLLATLTQYIDIVDYMKDFPVLKVSGGELVKDDDNDTKQFNVFKRSHIIDFHEGDSDETLFAVFRYFETLRFDNNSSNSRWNTLSRASVKNIFIENLDTYLKPSQVDLEMKQVWKDETQEETPFDKLIEKLREKRLERAKAIRKKTTDSYNVNMTNYLKTVGNTIDIRDGNKNKKNKGVRWEGATYVTDNAFLEMNGASKQQLKRVNLNGAETLTSITFDLVPNMTNLTHLLLANTNFDDSSLMKVLTSVKSIKVLDLSSTKVKFQFDDQTVKNLKSGENVPFKQLKKVKFDYTEIDHVGVLDFLDMLPDPADNLTHVSFHSVDYIMDDTIVRLLNKCPNITHLDLYRKRTLNRRAFQIAGEDIAINITGRGWLPTSDDGTMMGKMNDDDIKKFLNLLMNKGSVSAQKKELINELLKESNLAGASVSVESLKKLEFLNLSNTFIRIISPLQKMVEYRLKTDSKLLIIYYGAVQNNSSHIDSTNTWGQAISKQNLEDYQKKNITIRLGSSVINSHNQFAIVSSERRGEMRSNQKQSDDAYKEGLEEWNFEKDFRRRVPEAPTSSSSSPSLPPPPHTKPQLERGGADGGD